jgi:hypothetical protein
VQIDTNQVEDEARIAVDVLYSKYEASGMGGDAALDSRFLGDDGDPDGVVSKDVVADGEAMARRRASGDHRVHGDVGGDAAASGASATRDRVRSVDGGGGGGGGGDVPDSSAPRRTTPVATYVLLLTDKRVRILESKSNKVVWSIGLFMSNATSSNAKDKAKRVMKTLKERVATEVMDTPSHQHAHDSVDDDILAVGARLAAGCVDASHATVALCACLLTQRTPLVTFTVSGPTLAVVVETTRRGFVMLCRTTEASRLMWQAADDALRGVADRKLLHSLYVHARARSSLLWALPVHILVAAVVPPSLYRTLKTCGVALVLARVRACVSCRAESASHTFAAKRRAARPRPNSLRRCVDKSCARARRNSPTAHSSSAPAP